jgi:hypothetical protein
VSRAVGAPTAPIPLGDAEHDAVIQGRRCQALWAHLVYESIGVDGTIACDDIYLECAGLDPVAVRDRERRGLVKRLDGSRPRTGPTYHERCDEQRRRRGPTASSPEQLAAEAQEVLELLPAGTDELAEVLERPKWRVQRALKQLQAGRRVVYVYKCINKWMTPEQWKLTAAEPAVGRKST